SEVDPWGRSTPTQSPRRPTAPAKCLKIKTPRAGRPTADWPVDVQRRPVTSQGIRCKHEDPRRRGRAEGRERRPAGLQEEGHAVDVAAEGAAALDLLRRARHGGEAGAGFGRLRRTR